MLSALYACKGAHTLFAGQRERVRKRERGKIYPEFLFLFLKGMMGALGPFIYLVYNNN
jgi:hypothetical protein